MERDIELTYPGLLKSAEQDPDFDVLKLQKSLSDLERDSQDKIQKMSKKFLNDLKSYILNLDKKAKNQIKNQ